MATLRYKCKVDCCMNGCKDWGSCDGHEYEIIYQSTSDYLSFYDNGENVFCIDVCQVRILYEVLNRLSRVRVEIRPDEKIEIN